MEQNNQDRYKMVIGESHVTTDDAFVAADVKAILDKHFDENNNVEVYKRCFNAIDLTTLNSTDTVSSVTKFVTRVNDFETEYPELPNVAAICVYPNFAMVVSGALEVSGVQKAVVAGSFPSSQTFLEIKTTEAASNLVVYPELGLASAEFLQEMLGQKYIIASLPYGMQNLLQWLKKIALSLDMQTDFTELKKDVSYNQEKFDTAIFQLR